MNEKRTLRYQASLLANKVSRTFLKDEFALRRKIRVVVMPLLEMVYGKKGYPVKIGGVVECKMHPQFFFSNWQNFGQGHNSGFRECLKVLKPDSIFFDVGAHIGLFTIPASRLITGKGAVYSFEPSSANFKMLSSHISLNKAQNAYALNCLVGRESKANVEFYEDENDINPMNSISLTKKPENYRKTSKEQVTLDSFCTSKNVYPDVVKIDVEGAELDVLEGAKDILRTKKPVVFLSLHPRHIKAMNRSLSELEQIADEVGYQILDLNHTSNRDFHSNECLLVPVT